MKIKIEELKDSCTGCTACKSICPAQCILMELDKEGFYFPRINYELCLHCHKCETVCSCLNRQEEQTEQISWYGWNKNPQKRFNSSSGGAFEALAEEIINQGGIVYGAVFDCKSRRLIHGGTDEYPLEKIMKSKYVESDLNDTFTKIQNNVKQGKKVLFCGTPCQTDGLRRVINDPQGFLNTCDFICHGVPCTRFLTEHLDYLHGKKELKGIDFRPKEDGWHKISLKTVTDRRVRMRFYAFDSFYYGFMTLNLFLRRSCYSCQYKEHHSSDIILADFWNYQELGEDLNDEKGLSLIIANHEKGYKLVKSIEPTFELHQIDNKYSQYVFAPRDYTAFYQNRSKFYEIANQYGFEKAASKTYMRGRKLKYILYLIKTLIKKLLGKY